MPTTVPGSPPAPPAASKSPGRQPASDRSAERSGGGDRRRDSGPQTHDSSTLRWPLERILFLMAGTMTGLSAVLSALVSPWFLLLTGFVAANQLAFVALGNCPSSWALRRWLGVEAAADRCR